MVEEVPLTILASVAPDLSPGADLAPVAPDLGDDRQPPALLQSWSSWSAGGRGPDLAVVLTRVLYVVTVTPWSVMHDDHLTVLHSPGTQGDTDTGGGAAAQEEEEDTDDQDDDEDRHPGPEELVREAPDEVRTAGAGHRHIDQVCHDHVHIMYYSTIISPEKGLVAGMAVHRHWP